MDIQAQREEFKSYGRFLVASPHSFVRDWDHFVEEARCEAKRRAAVGSEPSPEDWLDAAFELAHDADQAAAFDADRRRRGYYVFHAGAGRDESEAEAAAA